MLPYILLLAYTCVLGLYIFSGKPITRKRNIAFVRWSFLGAFLLQALRGASVGWDTSNYIIGFDYYKQGRSFRNWEPLFRLLNYIVGLFTNNAQWLLAVSSLIILIGYGIFIIENTEEKQSTFWQVFFFITLNQYFVTTNLLRQALAMAFGLNVYTVMKKDQSTKSVVAAVILSIIASQFHITAIVCLILMVPFLFKSIERKTIVLVGVLSALLFYGFSIALNVFVRVFPRYYHYLYSKYMSDTGMSGYYVLTTVLKIAIVAVIFLTLNPKREENKTIYQLSFIMVMSVGVAFLQTRTALAVRFGYYLEVFIILAIPEFIRKFKKGKGKFLVTLFFFVFGLSYFIYVMSVGSARGCVPYVFFWQ